MNPLGGAEPAHGDAGAPGPCPSEDELVALLDAGPLPAGERPALAAHLDACARCRETVAAVVALEPHQGNDQLGRYRLEQPLGAGAMGLVWAAWDPELERRVAIKLLRTDSADADARTRLLREARALARLQHPNVLAVHDVGEAMGEVFVATELVDGEPIGAWQVGRPWRQIVDAYLQAARGVAAAHGAGLIHRDIKPANIFVGRDGRVRVGDFGLAVGEGVPPPPPSPGATPARPSQRLALGSGPDRLALGSAPDAGTGADGHAPLVAAVSCIAGTPEYMAPEQLESVVIDARVDQFALALALTEALGGQRVPAGTSAAEVSALVPAEAPAALAQALATALAVRPDDRFASVEVFVVAIERALAPTPSAAVDPTVAVTPGRRRRAWWPALALIAVVGGVVGAGWWATRPSGERGGPAPTQVAGGGPGSDVGSSGDRGLGNVGGVGVGVGSGVGSGSGTGAGLGSAGRGAVSAGSAAQVRTATGGKRRAGPGTVVAATPAAPISPTAPPDFKAVLDANSEANRHFGNFDGVRCLHALDRVPEQSATDSLRSMCEMLAGRCDDGITRLRKYGATAEQAGLVAEAWCPVDQGPTATRVARMVAQQPHIPRACARYDRLLRGLASRSDLSDPDRQALAKPATAVATCLGKRDCVAARDLATALAGDGITATLPVDCE
ncbi:MAG: protein kinase [Kofleriaceae bacterium]|nr:protein kinase [Kofleriaceae bacterium]